MSERQVNPYRVQLEGIDWVSLLPFLRLFRSFRMAIHPAKIFTALFLVVLLYLSGRLLDAIWGRVVYRGEIVQHSTEPREQFNEWLKARELDSRSDLLVAVYGIDMGSVTRDQFITSPDRFAMAIQFINAHYNTQRSNATKALTNDSATREFLDRELAQIETKRRARIATVLEIEPDGIFDAALRFEVDAFERLLTAAVSLNLGYSELLQRPMLQNSNHLESHGNASVIGALKDMFITVPGWLFDVHPGFFAAFCTIGFILWTILGGAIARMAALHATRDERIDPNEAIRFSVRRWPSLVFAPVIPLVVAASIGLVLFLFGLILFGIPGVHLVTDILGGLLFVVVIVLSFAVVLLLIGLMLGANLLYPAVAVDGADGFDANSRAFNYVTGRPWQLLFYTLAALVYGAITYLFVAVVVFLTLLLAHQIVGWGAGVFMNSPEGIDRFDQLFREPNFGRLAYNPEWSSLRTTGRVAAVLIMVWTYLFVGLLGAYAISYYFTAQTWIYLLLRRSADGTEFDDVYVGSKSTSQAQSPSLPDKVERGTTSPGGGASA
ncbi:MAG: hypothetical protein IT444_03610 [Phycisphaeraceae bacterium]|nr:hypothetical protein [Phycisphaeraceae bacterium]